MNNKIMYIAGYFTGEERYKRMVSLAANTKITSILSVLNKLKIPTQILNLPKTCQIVHAEQECVTVNNFVQCLFLKQNQSKNKYVQFFYRIGFYLRLACYLYKNTQKGDFLWVYHANLVEGLFLILAKIKRLNIIYEVEEIYGDVSQKSYKKFLELQLFKLADAYIFPTQQLNRLINTRHKPVAIIEGTYQVEPVKAVPEQDGFVHVVYAGTLDPRKGGAIAAAAAAAYLPFGYHMHILGFGTTDQIKYLENQIQQVQQKTKCKVTFDGLKIGEEYIHFLQTCHIGLSTQNPDAAFNATSFPSKILSYMANGLHVVSIRIPVIEESAISDLLTYYDEQTPQEIAKAIMAVDLKAPYDSRARLRQLDQKFQQDLQKLLNHFSHETVNE